MNKKTEDVNIYDIYIKDIRKYGTIDDVKTRECLEQYQKGNTKERKMAKERIIGTHQRFVRSIANKYANNANLMDIISEGNIGLMTAIEKYDLESNVKFTTYAMYWIRKTIMAYITLNEPMVTPNNAIKLATYVPKIRENFWIENQRNPSDEEVQIILSEKYNLNFSNKEDLQTYQSTSIDEKYGEDEDGQEFMETNAYTSRTASCNTDAFVKGNDTKVVVNEMLSSLSERDAYILKCIYGIDGKQKTMNDVAEEVGISYERVRQIAANSVEKLGKKYENLVDAY